MRILIFLIILNLLNTPLSLAISTTSRSVPRAQAKLECAGTFAGLQVFKTAYQRRSYEQARKEVTQKAARTRSRLLALLAFLPRHKKEIAETLIEYIELGGDIANVKTIQEFFELRRQHQPVQSEIQEIIYAENDQQRRWQYD